MAPEQNQYISSHSKNAPFSTIFEDDGKGGYVYATSRDKDNHPEVEDIIELYIHKEGVYLPFDAHSDVKIVWSNCGEKSALLIQNTFYAIFDFSKKASYSKILDTCEDSIWKRFKLEWTDDLIAPFKHHIIPNPTEQLEEAVSLVSENNSEANRLKLYRALMQSSLILPISAPEHDLTHNYLIFPNEENNGFVLFAFIDHESFAKRFGDEIYSKSTPCNSLFKFIQNRQIQAVVISNQKEETAVIYESEYSTLSFATNINQLNYLETIKSLASVMLQNPDLQHDDPIFSEIEPLIQGYDQIKEAYIFQSSADDAPVTLGLILNKREERRLIEFYRDLRILNKKYLGEDKEIELSVLKEGEHLLSAVREQGHRLYPRSDMKKHPESSN